MKKFSFSGNWVRVIDGNTLILNLDLGLHTAHIGPFQLLGVEAAPVSGAKKTEGLQMKEKLQTLLLTAGEIRVETHKPDKYGRWLAEIFFTNEAGEEISINKKLTES